MQKHHLLLLVFFLISSIAFPQTREKVHWVNGYQPSGNAVHHNVRLPGYYNPKPGLHHIPGSICPKVHWEVSILSFLLFDPSEVEVFRAHQHPYCWDGKVHGQMAPEGSYRWEVVTCGRDGTVSTKIGTINVIR